MRKIINILTFAFVVFGIVACDDKGGTAYEPSNVSYIALAGSWQLTEMEGLSVNEGTYIVLERRALEGAEAMGWRPYQIYSNLESVNFRQTTGLFMLKTDDYDRIYVTGLYDHSVGNSYYWSADYFVSLSSDRKTMIWTAVAKETGNPVSEDTRKFTRITSVPSEITDLFPVEQDEQ